MNISENIAFEQILPDANDAEDNFEMSPANTMSFYLSGFMNLGTFYSNYIGQPFMESVRENIPYFKVLVMAAFFLFSSLLGVLPFLNGYLQLVPLTDSEEFPLILGLLFLDFIGVFVLERFLRFYFAVNPSKDEVEEIKMLEDRNLI
ncbi:putative cation-transporting ATPase 1 [Bonamia ostreae]|uniref:Cation-transporting ATPase 1 n=1 Tax=Bonamia ostreae TaxID=126728 RepID=A0ABV2AEL9_9EUKA